MENQQLLLQIITELKSITDHNELIKCKLVFDWAKECMDEEARKSVNNPTNFGNSINEYNIAREKYDKLLTSK